MKIMLKNIILLGLFYTNTPSFATLFESECFNQDRIFIFNDEVLNFNVAQAACQAQNQSANLVKIESQQVFDLVEGFVLDTVGGNTDFWIGLSRGVVANQNISREPLSFSFIDGTTFVEGEFGSVRSVPPWQDFVPNDFAVDESCVRYRSSVNLFSDFICNTGFKSVCERSCAPTPNPTFKPTTLSPILTATTLSPLFISIVTLTTIVLLLFTLQTYAVIKVKKIEKIQLYHSQ